MHPLRLHIQQIVPLTDAEFDYVLSMFSAKTFKKHDFLLKQGDLATYEFFVLSGLLKASCMAADGKEHILQFASENWWISDYQAFWNHSPSNLWISCLENVEVLAISLDKKNEMCSKLHKMEHFFHKKSNGGYMALQRRILGMLNSSAEERFRQFSANYPGLLQRVPKKLIASFLGVSRETLSRLSR